LKGWRCELLIRFRSEWFIALLTVIDINANQSAKQIVINHTGIVAKKISNAGTIAVFSLLLEYVAQQVAVEYL
jgi:hypothetical protein